MTENMKTLLGELRDDKVSVDTIIPLQVETPPEVITDGSSDESKLTYDELLEEYIRFNKSAIMKPETFDRLWN